MTVVIWIALLLVGAQLTLTLHEASHALCIKLLYGGEILEFKPYPNPLRELGKFGIVRSRLPSGVKSTPWSYRAPLLKALSLILLWGLLGILVYGPLLAFAIWETLDAALWLFQYWMPSWYRRARIKVYKKFDASQWWYRSFGEDAEFPED